MAAPDDDELAQALAGARPEDPAGLALARARIATALFGGAASLGRFRVLERLGRGAMGVVYAAYDPQLDRKVALKMVSVAGDRDAALAEAKSLARVSHPNIVPVYDIGLVEDHVYIVMELVPGPTLRDWVRSKSSREIVEVYRQAATGLAAAHAAGLVHRDFKPDNAIVGADGRVRVVDFGLACEADSGAGRTGGTPKYMAPEQARGIVSAAGDQYSFCVALAEALEPSPVPRWIDDILARGRAEDRAARWPSMSELARALGRDPARVWRWRAIAGGAAIAIAVTAFLVGRARSSPDVADACTGGDREIAAAFPPAARAAEVARIATLSAYGRDLAPRLETQLADFAARWAAGYRGACLAADPFVDRRIACLERGRVALATFAEIAAGANASALPGVANAAAALPDPEPCSDLATLASDTSPPPAALAPQLAPLRDDLERAKVQLAAGRATAARDLAHTVAERVRAIGYPPLLAEAELVEGHALMVLDDGRAVAVLRAATATAFASDARALGVEAWARRAWIDAVEGRADALAGFDVVEPTARAARGAAFGRALLHNSAGTAEMLRGNRAAARAAFERALEPAREVRGRDAIELVTIRRNLGMITDDPDRRERLLREVHGEHAQRLGPTHPEALLAAAVLATNGIRSPRAAAALLAETCARYELHDALASELPPCLAELGELYLGLGERAAAGATFERAASLPASQRAVRPELDGYRELARGDPAAALAAFDAMIAAHPLKPNQAYPSIYTHARLVLGRARALRAGGRDAEARRAYERVLEVLRDDAMRDARGMPTLRRRLDAAAGELAALTGAAGSR